jgi:hypothetical protein
VDKFDNPFKNGRISFGHHAVPEIENMCRVSGISAENIAGGFSDDLPRSKCESRIKVPLKGDVRGDPCPSDVERHPPINADDVCTRAGHEAKEFTSSNTEMNARNIKVGNFGEDALTVRKHELLIIGRAQRSGPRVEDLQRNCTIRDL